MINKKLIEEYEKNAVYSNTPEIEVEEKAKIQHELLNQMTAEDVEYLLQDAIKEGAIVQYKIHLKKIMEEKRENEKWKI